MDAQLNKEIALAVFKLRGISKAASRASSRALTRAAQPLVHEIQFRAPTSDEPHSRYDTPKASKRLKAPKGQGKVVATYTPGNLERSFDVLKFRRSRAVFVGPKVDKAGSRGLFSGGRTDGYYGQWQEFGAPNAGIVPRPFVAPAVAAARNEVGQIAVAELKKAIERYA